jgi:hypothetical protein
VRSAGFDAWTQDGKSLLVSTRFGDVGQLHRLDRDMGVKPILQCKLVVLIFSMVRSLTTVTVNIYTISQIKFRSSPVNDSGLGVAFEKSPVEILCSEYQDSTEF